MLSVMLNSIVCRMRVNCVSILVAVASETHQKVGFCLRCCLKNRAPVRSFSLERSRKYFDKWIAQNEQFPLSLRQTKRCKSEKLIKAWSCRMESIDMFGWEWKLRGLMKENRKACRNNPWIDRTATTWTLKWIHCSRNSINGAALERKPVRRPFVDISACLLINHPASIIKLFLLETTFRRSPPSLCFKMDGNVS